MTQRRPDKIEPPEDGLHPNASERDYIQWDAVSVSRIKGFALTPAHVWAYMTKPPDPKPAQELGSAIHMASLQPELFETRYFCGPSGDRRTKGVKEAWAIAEEDHPGGIGLRQDDWDTCRGVRDSLWTRHAYAASLLGGDGYNECPYVWTDRLTGLRCKAKADRITMAPNGRGVIADLKSIKEASDHSIEQAIHNYGYHIQGDHFIDGLDTIMPAERLWILIFVESSRPWGVRCKELGLATMELGKRERQRYLNLYAQCEKTGEWPGYPQGLELADVKDWVFRQEEKDEEAREDDQGN